MIFSKFIKLITHFVRYPVDILLWPVSILFGWFHGAIKVWALLTLNEVRKLPPLLQTNTDSREQTTWGSRAGADADDKDRMIPQAQRESIQYDQYYDEQKYSEKQGLLYDDMNTNSPYEIKRTSALAA